MSERFCCDNLCEQGRDCPVRNQPIIPKSERELMQMALDAMINALAGNDFDNPCADMKQAVKALRDRLAQPDLATVGEVGIWGEIKPCKTHPDAPHGFDRNASHSEDRYVCECEYWEPPPKREGVGLKDQEYVHEQQKAWLDEMVAENQKMGLYDLKGTN